MHRRGKLVELPRCTIAGTISASSSRPTLRRKPHHHHQLKDGIRSIARSSRGVAEARKIAGRRLRDCLTQEVRGRRAVELHCRGGWGLNAAAFQCAVRARARFFSHVVGAVTNCEIARARGGNVIASR